MLIQLIAPHTTPTIVGAIRCCWKSQLDRVLDELTRNAGPVSV